ACHSPLVKVVRAEIPTVSGIIRDIANVVYNACHSVTMKGFVRIEGFSGVYHYDTRGMLTILPESPNFKVRLTLDIK
ncbi:hypothetical protein LINPERHAP1_LOCUS8378, partial [Linum perenne]